MYKANKDRSSCMDNNLKLSYEMLFENGADLDEAEDNEAPEAEMFSHEEMQQRLEAQEQQWIEQMEQERTEAESRGFQKGLEEGKKKMQASFEERLSSVKNMLESADDQFNEVIDELKPHMAGLVFDMTEKVLDVPHLDPQIHEHVNEEVLKLVGELNEQLHVKVTVAEEEHEMIQRTLKNKENLDRFTLRVDKSHNPGEYEIETKKETIVKNFKKMILDFRESVNFNKTGVSPEV